MPFFPDVHEEVTRSWKAPLSSRDCSAASSALPPLDQAAAKGYNGVPQVERSVAMQLCPQSASSRGDPKHPSKACSMVGDNAPVMRAEVATLLAKGLIETVPPAEMKSGFYSPYFIVPKKSGGL
ncbi:hypothetical protein PO909_007910 [Leuciscus waleckii]